MIPDWYLKYKSHYDVQYKVFRNHPNHRCGYRYEDIIRIFRDALVNPSSISRKAWNQIIWECLDVSGIGISSGECYQISSRRSLNQKVEDILRQAVAEYDANQKPFSGMDYL